MYLFACVEADHDAHMEFRRELVGVSSLHYVGSGTSGVSGAHPYPLSRFIGPLYLILRQGLSLYLEFTSSVELASLQAPEISLCACLLLPSSEIAVTHHNTWLLGGCWALNPGPHALSSKHLTDRATSPALDTAYGEQLPWSQGLSKREKLQSHQLLGTQAGTRRCEGVRLSLEMSLALAFLSSSLRRGEEQDTFPRRDEIVLDPKPVYHGSLKGCLAGIDHCADSGGWPT